MHLVNLVTGWEFSEACYDGVVAFSSLARILEECSTNHSPPALFLLLLLFFRVEISSRKLIPLFRSWPVHRGSASWDDYNRVFPDELRVISFPDRFPHCLSQSDFDGSRVNACLGVTCHLHYLAEWPWSFKCHRGNTGVERTPNESQHTKWTPEKKILPPLLPGFELATFRSGVRGSTNRLSWL